MKLRKLTAVLLLLAALVQLAGCAGGGASVQPSTASEPLPDEPTSAPVSEEPASAPVSEDSVLPPAQEATFSQASADFAAELLHHSFQTNENTTLSPYSVLTALAMAAGGANGETLREMEAVFGLPIDRLNSALKDCRALPGEELLTANSLWIRDDIDVLPEFLESNESFYGAEVYRAPFDGTTVKTINNWIAEHTKDRLKDVIDSLDPTAALCLVNALTFDDKWQDEFEENNIREGEFHAASGKTQTVDMMHGGAECYLASEGAVGFVKHYDSRHYDFIALLPNENVGIEDYVNQLDGSTILELLENQSKEPVAISMPRFKTEYKTELSAALRSMGMPLAFDRYAADFTRMADLKPDERLYIGSVIHQTYLSVDGAGTEAAAATVVEIYFEATAIDPQPEPKRVILDRPFVWLIWDTRAETPVFIGVVNSVAK